MALSMQGAFAQARQGKLERRRRGIQRELSSAAELAGMLGAKQTAAAVAEAEAAHAAAHARDFTTKQWHQQVMPLMNMRKLIVKIYEALCCEFYAVSSSSRMRGREKTKPPLHDYIEDSLILQYGMRSLARKTLLQMIATAHKHYETQPRVRMFAELAGAVPPRWSALTTCPAEAQDFFFYALSTLLPARKVADMMSSVRTAHITLEAAVDHVQTVLQSAPANAEDQALLLEELREIARTDKNGAEIVDIDDLLEHTMQHWCDMANAQQELLLKLFTQHDENGDGQLSLSEFDALIRGVTPEASQSKTVELYKRCLEASAPTEVEAQAEASMDAIKPDAFLAVVLPHYLNTMMQTAQGR